MFDHDPDKYRRWRWWTVTLRGVAAIIFGALAIAFPKAAILSLVVLFGLYAIADGILALSLGVGAMVSRGAMYARGVVSLLAGILALVLPGVAGLALVLLVGGWAVLSGIFEIIMSVRFRDLIEGEWLLGLEGALSIVFGMMLFFSPLAGAIVLGLWLGIYALVVGGMMVVSGLRLRTIEHSLPAAA